MKFIKTIQKFFEDSSPENLDKLSKDQSYNILKDEILDDNTDVRYDIDYFFDEMEESGIDPYSMTFDEFYNYIILNFTVNYRKDIYQPIFKEKIDQRYENQLKIPFKD